MNTPALQVREDIGAVALVHPIDSLDSIYIVHGAL